MHNGLSSPICKGTVLVPNLCTSACLKLPLFASLTCLLRCPLPDFRLHRPLPMLTLQYGEFRSGYAKDQADTRIVSYGIRYLIENYVSRQWTMTDVEMADAFYRCAKLGAPQLRRCLSAAWGGRSKLCGAQGLE